MYHIFDNRYPLRKYILSLFIILITAAFTSCGRDDEPVDPPGSNDENTAAPDNQDNPISNLVFVYAVNNSSLYYDFIDDKKEMEEAMSKAPDGFDLLLYCIHPDENSDSANLPVLLKYNKKGGEDKWDVIKVYDAGVPSTDADRIRNVICDGLNLYPDANANLFFWGHGSGWVYSRGIKASNTESIDFPDSQSYGGEFSDHGVLNTNIDLLAAALPDGRFDTIWFDCCYMSNIEIFYEFRNKCHTMVAYPTEVYSEGLPYNRVIPYFFADKPDIMSAARDFFDYYNDAGDPVTVTCVDMSKIESVANASKEILSLGLGRPAKTELINYSRSSSYSLYDFGKYMELTAKRNLTVDDGSKLFTLVNNFRDALDSFVLYHDASAVNFWMQHWDISSISGISTHWFADEESVSNDYYRTLQWYKRVY